jgi:hypothetical protein
MTSRYFKQRCHRADRHCAVVVHSQPAPPVRRPCVATALKRGAKRSIASRERFTAGARWPPSDRAPHLRGLAGIAVCSAGHGMIDLGLVDVCSSEAAR